MRALRPNPRRSRTGRSRPSDAGPLYKSAGRWIERLLAPAFRELPRNLLAEFDPELVERIDAKQDGIGECPVLVEGDQSSERARIEAVEKDRRARPIAG